MVDIISTNQKIWKQRILDLVIEHPEYNATQVRQDLIETIGEESTPGKSAIQKEWARLRSENSENSELDAPWHLGVLDTFPVDNEAVPVLLEQQKTESAQHTAPLSIRQAKWISRLHGVIRDRRLLTEIARYYALREKTSELSGQRIFNTIQYDLLLHDPEKLVRHFEEEKTVPLTRKRPSLEAKTPSTSASDVQRDPFGRSAGKSLIANHPSPPPAHDSTKAGYLSVNELFFYGDKILIRINVRGTIKRVVLPFSSQEELLNQLKSEHMIESMQSIGKDVTHIVLNKPLSISTENKQFREYLLHESQHVDIPGITRRE